MRRSVLWPDRRLKPPLGAAVLDRDHPLSAGLVGAWLFNEGGGKTFYDLSGREDHGTVTGMTWGAAAPGLTLKSGTSGQYAQVAGTNCNFGQTQEFSVCVRFRDLGGNANLDAIVEKWSNSGAYPFCLRYNGDNAVTFGRYDGTNVTELIGTVAVNDGAFHSVTGRKLGSSVYLTTDQTTVTTADLSAAGTTNASPLYVARRGGVTTRYYCGEYEYLLIYSRALSLHEVSALHADPYAMFRPRPVRRYYVAAAPPATTYRTGSRGVI